MGLGSWNDMSYEILRPVSCEATKPSSETALVFREGESLSLLGKQIPVEVFAENTPSVAEAAITIASFLFFFVINGVLDKYNKYKNSLFLLLFVTLQTLIWVGLATQLANVGPKTSPAQFVAPIDKGLGNGDKKDYVGSKWHIWKGNGRN